MTELSVLVQEQLATICAVLVIALVALFYDELAAAFQALWKKPQTLRGKIVHRYRLPAQKTLTMVDNVYSYVPVHTLEGEKFILDIEADGQRYQIEATEVEYRRLSIGDEVTIHH